jgi:aminopeptidase N
MEATGSPARVLQVAIPIFKNVTALDFVGPYEPLHILPNVNVVFVSHSKGLYTADQGMLSIEATATFDEVPSPDIIVVPGGDGTNALMADKSILDWIRKAHETSLYTTSVCSGSMLLGAAGILQGKEATTHWMALQMLSNFGAKPVSSRVVQSGKIITAAGVSAGIDMGLKLAALITDETTAKVVQLMMEYDPQPPFNCGSVATASPDIVAIARSWVEKMMPDVHLHQTPAPSSNVNL